MQEERLPEIRAGAVCHVSRTGRGWDWETTTLMDVLEQQEFILLSLLLLSVLLKKELYSLFEKRKKMPASVSQNERNPCVRK